MPMTSGSWIAEIAPPVGPLLFGGVPADLSDARRGAVARDRFVDADDPSRDAALKKVIWSSGTRDRRRLILPAPAPADPSRYASDTHSGWLAIIPMKRHSERVPGKNVRLMNGRPLYYWVLRTLFAVPAIETVVVDTDAEDIADLVRRDFPVEVSIRPEALRGDFVPTNDLIAHVLACHPQHERFVQTHVTNPLLTSGTIAAAIRAFDALPGRDSLFSVTRLQTRLYGADGRALNHDPARLIRTQDLAPVYEENSSLYLFTRASFAATRSRIGARPQLFEIPKLEALDIDDEDDFQLAEALMARPELARARAGAA